MSEIDGFTLRQLRKHAGVGLDRVAKQARVSASHLGRVERGVPDRPVTPAIVAAYEKVLGVKLGRGDELDPTGEPDREQLSRFDELRRRGFNATVAMLSVGGPLGEPIEHLLKSSAPAPSQVGTADVTELEAATTMVTALDLRFGGALAGQIAHGLLRWAAGLRNGRIDGPAGCRLDAAISSLARRAGWAAFDIGRHDQARQLFKVALDAAVSAGDANLRAHVLADIAAQYNELGYPEDCLQIVRLADGDERVPPAVQFVVHGVKARGYAALGDAAGCGRQIKLAEQISRQARNESAPEWMGAFEAAHVFAVTGHASATLALVTGNDQDRGQARDHLEQAVAGLHLTGRTRAAALCLTKLAHLHVQHGDAAAAGRWAERAVQATDTVHSARLRHGITVIRTAARSRDDEPAMRELVERLMATESLN